LPASGPLLWAEGRLERHARAGGAVNVLVRSVGTVEAPGGLLAQVRDFSAVDEAILAENSEAEGQERLTATPAAEIDDFRAVAPPVMSFAAGRRR
jgi:hypothetical protein